MTSKLILRELTLQDAIEAEKAHQETVESDKFEFLLSNYVPGEDFVAYLQRVQDVSRGINLPSDFVKASYLVADVGGEIVGRVSIRHELNERLAASGGHIGYCVRPAFRKNGYATEILKQALVIARQVGLTQVFVDCLDANIGSLKTIEKNGGQLERTYQDGACDNQDGFWRRYLIRL